MKYQYKKSVIIFRSIIVVAVWCGIISLFFSASNIGAFIFLSLFILLFIVPTLLILNILFSSIKNLFVIEADEQFLHYNLHQITISRNDIEKVYIKHTARESYLVIKFKDFAKYRKIISQTFIGKIYLLNYRTFGKSLLFINLSMIKDDVNELLKNVNKE